MLGCRTCPLPAASLPSVQSRPLLRGHLSPSSLPWCGQEAKAMCNARSTTLFESYILLITGAARTRERRAEALRRRAARRAAGRAAEEAGLDISRDCDNGARVLLPRGPHSIQRSFPRKCPLLCPPPSLGTLQPPLHSPALGRDSREMSPRSSLVC